MRSAVLTAELDLERDIGRTQVVPQLIAAIKLHDEPVRFDRPHLQRAADVTGLHGDRTDRTGGTVRTDGTVLPCPDHEAHGTPGR